MELFCWCGRWDLNPYVMDTRPSNVPVCRFQHYRATNDIIVYQIHEVKKFDINLSAFFLFFLSVALNA